MDTSAPEKKMIRVTFNVNYEMRGEPHHPDELVEKLNEAMDYYYIPSDNASCNPRWSLGETWREIIITGL